MSSEKWIGIKPWSVVDDDELFRLRECRRLLEMLMHDMDAAAEAHGEARGGGQHTNGRCCPFGQVSPGTANVFKRWVKEMMGVLE